MFSSFPLVPYSFITTHCALQFSSRGIRPGLTTVLARNLDKNTMGYLQWRWGTQSAMNTSIVRDTKTSHITVALQVKWDYILFIYTQLFYIIISQTFLYYVRWLIIFFPPNFLPFPVTSDNLMIVTFWYWGLELFPLTSPGVNIAKAVTDEVQN